jgi:hypothetical protein
MAVPSQGEQGRTDSIDPFDAGMPTVQTALAHTFVIHMLRHIGIM